MYTAILLVALVAGVSAQCVDEDANCVTWGKNGFCTNPFYASIVAKCKKSCNLCGVPVANCGTNSAMAVGPCFPGHSCQVGYGCSSVGNLCCPVVNTVDTKFQIGPAVGGMCPIGYTTVYGMGMPIDPNNDGVCIDINSTP